MLRHVARAGWMAGLILAALVAPNTSRAQTPPPLVMFTHISDAVPGRCYDPDNTKPDPNNPNRLVVAIHTGTVAGTFGWSAGCHASDEGPSMSGDTIVFVANAPPGYYISRISFSQTATTSGSRGGRGFAGANWVVAHDALSAAVGGTSTLDLTGKNLTVVPVSYTTVLAAAGGTVRSGSATATNPSATVELLPLEDEPPPPPPPPPVPTPTLSGLSPTPVTARGPAFTLTVTGGGFVPGSVVQWNGANRSTTPVNGSQLRAAILASDIAVDGMAEVRVFNPASGHYVPDDGGYSSPMSVTILPAPDPNPVPVAASLEPSSAIVGTGAFTLTVNGDNFIPGSVVRWNGQNRTTTFASPERLTAVIGVLDLFVVGPATVTVFNPATGFNPPPDGGTSTGLTFTVTDVPTAPPPVEGPTPTLAQGHVNDMRGRLWRQLTASRGLTRAALAQVCPQDGVTPCTGSIGGVDLTDWVWATAPQVFDLFSYFTTGVKPTTPSVSGLQYANVASQFQTLFAPTQAVSGCTTYQGCFDFRLSAGMTASTEAGGGPIGGSVTLSANEFGSFVGSFSVGAMADDASSTRGLFLWRRTGHSTGTVYAYDDVGQSTSPYGGLAVSLLANDWVAGAPATSSTATVSVVSPPSPPTDRITIAADGSVQTLPGALAGTYTLGYQACAGSTTNCDNASATVTVRSFLLVATNDSALVPYGPAVSPLNVLANDFLNGQAVNTTVVSLLRLSSPTGITLNIDTGAVNVAAGTPIGAHTLTYQVCEIASPTNCKTATVTLTLAARAIDAVDDVFPKLSKDGGTTPSVFGNDRFNGAGATSAVVQATVMTTLPAFVTFDATTGRFTIAKGVESGDYPVTYRICEIGNPTNCDTASLTLEISGSGN